MPVCELRSRGVREFGRRRAVILPLVIDGELAELASLAQLPLQGLGCQISCMRVTCLSGYLGISIPLSEPAAH